MHCDVVIVGYRLNAKEPAAKALERILGLFAEDARKLARSFPATVLAAGSQEQAERLMEQLTEAGALVELRASKPMPAPPPRGAQQASAGGPSAAQGRHASLPRASLPRMSRPAGGQSSLDFAPRPRLGPNGEAPKAAPPPPPPEALYQLGDFGLAAASVRPGPVLVMPPPPATGGARPPTGAARRASMATGMDLDLELSSMPLELDQPDGASRRGADMAHTASSDMRGERFSDSPPSTERTPQVEEAAFRAIQRTARVPEVRRSGAPRAPAQRATGALASTLREWVPSTLTLLAVSMLSLAAVGYALDPDDVFGALRRERASLFVATAKAPSGSRDEANLHPLLRATPGAARAPLAAILRGHIPGVHDVSVTFSGPAQDLHCAVVEQAEGETESRLERVRQTGRQVAIPGEVSAQLLERERSLRADAKRPDLTFVEICLSL